MANANPKSTILKELRAATQSEEAAVAFFERYRWGDCPACPRCGSASIYQMRGRNDAEAREANYRWRCRDCKRMYSVRTGLILEETRLPLRVWAYAFWKACASKKGVSALQISRECEISYKSALFLMHRIRFAMAEDHGSAPKLSGTVEVDEAWVGGKPRFAMRSRVDETTGEVRQYIPSTAISKPKTPIMALVQRGGKVRVRQIERVNRETLGAAVRELVEHGSTIYTDENPSYNHLSRSTRYRHESVNHTAKEYARGEVSTNTVEGFFSLIKRGVYGTFHSVSKHHLHRYLAEFEFRYNTRGMDDGERTLAAIKNSEGKRLLYAGPSTSETTHS